MTAIALFPLAIDICSINEISIVLGVGVEDCEGLGLIGAPTEYISTEAEWVDFKVSFIEGYMSHAEKFIALY